MQKSSNSTPARIPAWRTRKQEGEVIELAFHHKAVELGFAVTKPHGDSEPYDFIVDSGSRLWRVQIKSTHSRPHTAYFINTVCHSATQPYTEREIDFLVAHTAPEVAWYVIPVGALEGRTTIALHPHVPGGRGLFERFREAWCLMGCMRDSGTRASLALEPMCAGEGSCPLLERYSGGWARRKSGHARA